MVTLAFALVMATASSAIAQVDRFEIPAAGPTFVCDGDVYTVTGGTIQFQVRETDNHLSVTVKFRDVVAENDEGDVVRHIGSESVAAHSTKGHDMFHQTVAINLVSASGGGLVGRVQEVIHFSANANGINDFELTFGNCEGPIFPED